MTLDLLCQEMKDACWDSSESLGSLVRCVCCVGKVLLRKSERGLGAWKVNCHSKQKPFSHRGRAVTFQERDVEREKRKKMKECERQAEVSKVDLRVISMQALFASFLSWALRVLRFLLCFV